MRSTLNTQDMNYESEGKKKSNTKGKDIKNFLASMKKEKTKQSALIDDNTIKEKAERTIEYMEKLFNDRLEFLRTYLERALIEGKGELVIKRQSLTEDKLYDIIYAWVFVYCRIHCYVKKKCKYKNFQSK